MFLIKRKESSDEHQVKLVAYTIILYISSLFIPFVVVASYQSMVYYSRTHWLFATPFSSYITFMGAMFYIAVVLTLYLIFRQRWEGRRFKWTIIFLLMASIPAFYFSLTNYYYLDDDGIHYNKLVGVKESEYKWEDISKIQIVYRNHQGTTSLYQYTFDMANGEKVTLPFDNKLSENKRNLTAKIEENNIPVTDNFNNPIID